MSLNAAIQGFNVGVEVSTDGGTTYTVVGGLQGGDLQCKATMLDSTSTQSGGHKEQVKGLDEWTITPSTLFLASDAAQATIYTAFVSGSALFYRFRPKVATGVPQWIGQAIVSDYKLSGKTTDVETASITLAGTGVLNQSTQ